MGPASILTLALVASAQPPLPQLQCKALPVILAELYARHYAREQLIVPARQRSARQYIKALDPSKTLFLKHEVAHFEKTLPGQLADILKGDCSPLEPPAGLIIKRAAEDEAFVRKLLSDPKFKLDTSIRLVLDPEKRDYADTPKTRQQLIQHLVHFQVSNELLSGDTMALAKEHVLHRYELTTKRLRERREPRDLPEVFAEAYASSLDPHSSFLTAEDLADFRIAMQLSLEGIGALLRSQDGFIRIESLVPGGQAAKQNKLQPKDRIIAVGQDGEPSVSVIDMDLRDAVRMIRGPKGTRVTLTILRNGPPTQTFTVTIVRDTVDVKEQAAKIRYETRKIGKKKVKIGVLELPSFYGGQEGRSSYVDVARLLEEARKAKVAGLVLDLSRNGGGLLRDAVQISGLFLREGAMVGTQEVAQDFSVLSDDDPKIQYAGPLLVLISPASASASEIVAGALKSYQRAIIAGGKHSFGKGTVQQLSPVLDNTSAIKVTTGMFFLPSGQSTQERGVRSHIHIPSVMDGLKTGEKDLDYALPAASVKPFLSKLANYPSGERHYKPINPKLIGRLQAKSYQRVSKNSVFQKIKKELAEKTPDELKLSDLQKQTHKEDTDATLAKNRFETRHRVFQNEGVDILADLLRFEGR